MVLVVFKDCCTGNCPDEEVTTLSSVSECYGDVSLIKHFFFVGISYKENSINVFFFLFPFVFVCLFVFVRGERSIFPEHIFRRLVVATPRRLSIWKVI